MNKTMFTVERTQTGTVELDLNEVQSTSSIREAIREADETGQIKWGDMSPVKVSSIDMNAYIARCMEKGEKTPYNLFITAESKENALDLIQDYMAGVTNKDYTIKLSAADRYDIAKYINDSNSFDFESVIEIESDMEDDKEYGY